jgi:carboxyl-terminal processing protease
LSYNKDFVKNEAAIEESLYKRYNIYNIIYAKVMVYLKKVLSFLLIFVLISSVFPTVSHADDSLDEIKYWLNKDYVEPLRGDVLNSTDIDDLMDKIDDPYTTYMTPKELNAFIGSIEMQYVGIGVVIEQVPEGIMILSVFEGSGASEAGLLPGDIITEVDGCPLAGIDADAAITYISGDEGTYVSLTVKRGGEILCLKIERRKIDIPTIQHAMLDGKIGYIDIMSFGTDTAKRFEKAVLSMEQKGVKGYIIDLRGNGGGYLNTALELAGFFIDDNVAINTRNKTSEGEYRAILQKVRIEKPVIVLADEYSASASEAFIGAIRDYDKAYIVGNTTFGKGCMQNMYFLSNGGAIKLTTDYFFTPNGRTINKVGLPPDISIEGQDAQMIAAYLLQTGGSEAKKGIVGIDMGGSIFGVNLNLARQPKFWTSYAELIKGAVAGGKKIYAGTDTGWNGDLFKEDDIATWYYPGYDVLSPLYDVDTDKKFLISFNKEVDRSTLDNNIELIEIATGARVEYDIVEFTGDKVKIAPANMLKSNEEYIVVMHGDIRSTGGQKLKDGAICHIRTK